MMSNIDLSELRRLGDEVRAAQAALNRARDRVRPAAVAAVEAGAAKKTVADAGGVTPQTLYRWLGEWKRADR